MTAPVKVRVTLTVTVDPQAWAETYGNGTSAADVRADVRGYLLNHCQQATGILECDGTVAVTR